MRNAGQGEAQAGIKIVRRNINKLRYADDTTLEWLAIPFSSGPHSIRTFHHDPWWRKWRTKESLDESERVGLKLNIQKTKTMVSGPITSWQIHGETMETVTDFILWGSKLTADGDCSHEIKSLLLGRKVMTNLDSILKSRDITLLTNVHLVKAVAFLVVMYGCESLTIKKAEHWRIYAFELRSWRRLLRVPWTTKRSNQSLLKEINPELEGLILKL